MHAILHVQKVSVKATLPQPFEETEGEPGANNVIGESCRWELLLITDQDYMFWRVLERDQSAWFDGLASFIDNQVFEFIYVVLDQLNT